jgi:hypothetical protein
VCALCYRNGGIWPARACFADAYNPSVDLLTALGRIIPFAFASGVNLYATVAVAGLCSRYGLVTLPDQFRALDNPLVIGAAITMFVVEFVADKVPWVDTAWDAVHTVIRPVGGALVAMSALGDASPTAQGLAALLGGSVAMTTHLTKAGTRAVVNASPEPFTNWTLSFAEDLFVVALTWFATQHPMIATGIAIALLALIAAAGSFIVRAVRRRFARPA